MYQISLTAAYGTYDPDNESSTHSLFSDRIRTGLSSVKKRFPYVKETESKTEHVKKVKLKWEDYLQIYNFVHKNDISQRGADYLLAMLRDLHKRHNVDVPLPLNFKTILRCLEVKSDIVQGNVALT